MHVLSCVQFLETPWTLTKQDPLFLEVSRLEYWNGLLCAPVGDLPDPGIKPVSLACFSCVSRQIFLPLCHLGIPNLVWSGIKRTKNINNKIN